MSKVKAIRIASILGDFGDQPSHRIVLELRREEPNNQHDDVEYRWFERDGNLDTEISGRSVAEAMQSANLSWGKSPWELRFGR